MSPSHTTLQMTLSKPKITRATLMSKCFSERPQSVSFVETLSRDVNYVKLHSSLNKMENFRAFAGPKGGQVIASVDVSFTKSEKEEKLSSMSGIVTDASVPEGHKGLHGFLYGDSGADVHDAEDVGYSLRAGEDDGTSILPLVQYITDREGKKFAGVYAVYDTVSELQYIGFSRNVILALKGHRVALGDDICAAVKVKMYTEAALVTRRILDEQRQDWLNEAGLSPPGNSAQLHLWEGPSGPGTAAMSEAERSAYEEKKLKMRKAMGENLYDDVDGEELDAKERRLRLLKATEGDDWSSVIDSQTQTTLPSPSPSSPSSSTIVSPFSRPGLKLTEGENSGVPLELTEASVDEALNEVRPYLIADGGNVEVVGVESGVVLLRLQGACGTCPSSTATMKMGIERSLKNKFGDLVKDVMQVDRQETGATMQGVETLLDTLRPAITNFKGRVEVVSVDRTLGHCEVKYKGPSPVGMGVQAAIKDKFPDIRVVKLVGF